MPSPRKQYKSVDEYIGSFPKSVRDVLEKLRRTIQKAAPEAEEVISYQIPTYKLNGSLVHFAAFKNHIGFYPTSSVIKVFKNELSRYETAKGSVKFPMDKPIPFDLVRKIVEYRVKENSEK
ncbi:MAG TPA: DUF1801 domain-containing protein [Thermodesulfobacteriota bacterium]|nr:DUF1801 domain-containing protein [Thermodesulfobacteriota bacterium]